MVTTVKTIPRWQYTHPSECRFGEEALEYFNSLSIRKIKEVGSTISHALVPVEYISTGTGWGYLVPIQTISEKSKVVGEIVDSFVQPLQIISLVVDSLAILQWVQGKNDELEGNRFKLSRLFFTIGAGLSRMVTILNTYGLLILSSKILLCNNFFSGIASIASAFTKLIEVAKGESTFKDIALAVLALVSAGLAVYVLFHANLAINILYLTLSTSTLFLSRDDESEPEYRPEVTEIFHQS